MAAMDGLLDRRVSFQENVWAPPSREPTVKRVLDDIRRGTYAAQVQRLRQLISQGERDEYRVKKNHLPAVTFSGTFSPKRQLQDLKQYNDLLVLDIDHVSHDELRATSNHLRRDAHVIACWLSPSEEGVKGLVGLSYPETGRETDASTRHKAAFAQLSGYFNREYGISLDQSGSDITRLCFVSSDPDLHLRDDATCFAITELAPVEPDTSRIAPSCGRDCAIRPDIAGLNSLTRTEGKNRDRDRSTVTGIINYLEKRRLSITATHDKWVKVAFAIAATFTYNIGLKYFLRLCRLDGDAHDEEGSIRLLESCYHSNRGGITLGTISHYAQEAGYKRRELRDRGQH